MTEPGEFLEGERLRRKRTLIGVGVVVVALAGATVWVLGSTDRARAESEIEAAAAAAEDGDREGAVAHYLEAWDIIRGDDEMEDELAARIKEPLCALLSELLMEDGAPAGPGMIPRWVELTRHCRETAESVEHDAAHRYASALPETTDIDALRKEVLALQEAAQPLPETTRDVAVGYLVLTLSEARLTDVHALMETQDWPEARRRLRALNNDYADYHYFPQSRAFFQKMKAANTRIQQGRHEAAEVLEKAGRWADAAARWEEVDKSARAATAWERAEKWSKAGEAHMAAEAPEAALKAFERAKDMPKVAEILGDLGRDEDAAKLWESLERWSDAGDAWLAAEQLDAAAVAFEKGESWTGLADVRFRQERIAEAAQLYMKGKAWERASEVYTELEDWAGVGEALLAVGDPQGAAENFEKAGATERAAAAYETIALQHVERAAADKGMEVRLDAGRAFSKAGKSAEAKRWFEQARQLAVQHDNTDAWLRVSLEMGEFGPAVDTHLKRIRQLADEGEHFEAGKQAGTLLDVMKEGGAGAYLSLKEGTLSTLDDTLESLQEKLGAYPNVDALVGTNHYQGSEFGDKRFTYTSIRGHIANETETTIASVTVRIRLFAKDSTSFGGGSDWDALSEEEKQRFFDADAGYVEDKTFTALTPGERRRVTWALANPVPYQAMDVTMLKLARAK